MASIVSTASGTTNHHCLIKEHLESYLSFNHQQDLGTQLYAHQWRRHCRRLKIQDLIFAGYSLCKYTWEVVIYMVLTDKERLGSDIWPETLQ